MNKTFKLISYTGILILLSSLFISINLLFLDNYFEIDNIKFSIPLLLFSIFMFFITDQHDIAIIEGNEEKNINFQFLISIILLLIIGYKITLIACFTALSIIIIKDYIIPKNFKTIYRPIISSVIILLSFSSMNLVYNLCGGLYYSSIQPIHLLFIYVAGIIDVFLNTFLLSIAFKLDTGQSFKDIFSFYKNLYLWTYKYFFWDIIYAFVSAYMLAHTLHPVTWKTVLFGSIVVSLMLYPLWQRQDAFKLSVIFNKQNKDLEKLNTELKETNKLTVKAFLACLEAKDKYTKNHSARVAVYASKLATKFDFSSEEIKVIETAGLIHDMGKIEIPEAILNKVGRLTDEEFDLIKKHPIYSLKMVNKTYNNLDLSKEHFSILSNIASLHHERFDGKGYPNGLKGEEIPLEARILAAVDAFDAMTSTRSYRQALSIETAREELIKNKGTQFCPLIVDKFIECINEGLITVIEVENLDTAYEKYSIS